MNPVFADKSEAEMLLGELDAYTSNLNEFELMAKLQTNEKITVSDYLDHAKEQALSWNNELMERVLGAIANISIHLELNPMPLPEEVHFVLTTGLEEVMQLILEVRLFS